MGVLLEWAEMMGGPILSRGRACYRVARSHDSLARGGWNTLLPLPKIQPSRQKDVYEPKVVGTGDACKTVQPTLRGLSPGTKKRACTGR